MEKEKNEFFKNEKIVYQNRFINVTEEKIKGNKLLRVYFEPSVHIIPISENGKIWMIREYRVAEKKAKWTLPGGSLEKNQTPKQCAVKELREELGFKAKKLKLFYKMPYLKKANNEKRYYFVADDLVSAPLINPDGEVIYEKKEFSIEVLKQKVLNGDFDWSPIAFVILKLARETDDGKIKLKV